MHVYEFKQQICTISSLYAQVCETVKQSNSRRLWLYGARKTNIWPPEGNNLQPVLWLQTDRNQPCFTLLRMT